MANLRTCTTMIFTDGHNSTYAVMVGPMRGKGFRSDRAEIIAMYDLTDKIPDYRGMTAAHATANAPAVYWQA